MTSTTKMTSLAAGLLLICGASSVARAALPSAYSPREGTVLSTHTPETNACPITWLHLSIGPRDTVQGTIDEGGTNSAWPLSGTYDQHGTFHLNGEKPDGTESTGSVDAQVESNGALSLRMANIDPSQCFNRTVYLPWFRNGNDFGPSLSGGGG